MCMSVLTFRLLLRNKTSASVSSAKPVRAMTLRKPAQCRVSGLCATPAGQPEGIGHLRPITVLSSLHRLWTSTLSKALLDFWGGVFFKGVTVSMPGRSPRDTSLTVELLVEKALVSSEALSDC